MTTWYTLEAGDVAAADRLEDAWIDAPTGEVAEMLLEVARDQVIEYAPTPVAGEDIQASPKTRYVLAQLQQAKNLWNAGRVSGEGDVGPDGFTFTPRPLDKTIRGIIRPKNGKPRVF